MNDQRPDSLTSSSEQVGGSGSEEGRHAILAQFYTAEYEVFMGRVSSWESLQYGAWPILIAALGFLFQIESIPWRYRWWLGLLIFLCVYVAYQGTMVNMLYSVLLIERDLRPRASELVGNNDFWIYERVREKNFPSNPAWSMQWPIVISFFAIGILSGSLVYTYGIHWQDGIFFAAALVLGAFVTHLTQNAKRVKKDIVRACVPRLSPPTETASE